MERENSTIRIKARTVSPGKAEGEALVYKGAFSFMGDVDPTTGRVPVRGHLLEGMTLANKVFIFATGKGSSSGDTVVWNAKKKGTAPTAIICLESEPVLSSGVIASEIPMVDRPERDVFTLIETGDWIKVDATAGVIDVLKR